MHPAALPGCAEQDRGDGLLESGVGIGDDQLHPAQPAGLEGAQERGPERAVLAVADGEARDLAPAVGADSGGDDDGLGDDPVVDPRRAVGRVEEHVGERLLGQAAVAERTDLGGRDPRRSATPATWRSRRRRRGL